MPGVRVPPLVPLRGRAAAIPTVGLPPVAGPTEGEHRLAPRPAAPHRAPQPGFGAHAWPPLPRRRRRVRRRRGVTWETDRPAWEAGGASPGGLRSRAHGARRRRERTRSRDPSGTRSCRCENGSGARPRSWRQATASGASHAFPALTAPARARRAAPMPFPGRATPSADSPAAPAPTRPRRRCPRGRADAIGRAPPAARGP